ncbi:PREDICTED: E3 ubiquitin-protein ligase TRIM31-like [Chrysochloris asiatica]|uniref:E3 ubiquitin-protein ligase TRIM31-like n=1 Tax=Chrysochloris asiatica TaxID=185453 RepID=A0A9B0U4D9_CHRAS|nr:PREDICTED: E3 ubiquitin-protein ligase TRIM31-like [Chrysochloris asiatica]
MTSSQVLSRLQEEVICPICLEILQDPVTIICGHNFCFRCITKNVGPSDNLLKCPLCKKSVMKDTLKPNWLLVNLVEKIQILSPFEEQPEMQELKCPKHQEKFHYFCENDGKFLCVVCHQSKEHKLHKISLIEEAAPKYQVLIQSQLETLQQKEKALVQMNVKGEQKISEFKAQVKNERQKIIQEFKHLHQVLQEEEKLLLSQVDRLDQEGAKEEKIYITSSEALQKHLGRLAESLKAKQKMSSRDLLWDIKVVLYRCKAFQLVSLTPVSTDLEKKLSDAISRHNSIVDTLKKCRDNLLADKKKYKSMFFIDTSKNSTVLENNNSKMNTALEPESPSTAPVTLDATSAHPDLILSQDLKTVKLDIGPLSNSAEPADPRCFYPFRCVVGLPSLSSGKQTWEAELQGPGGGACLVGVVSEHAPRRGFLQVEPKAGFWVLRIKGTQCQALIQDDTREVLPIPPSKVGVHVDHDRGEVVFYDAITSKHIYTFQASFQGRIFPFFRLLYSGTQITLSP